MASQTVHKVTAAAVVVKTAGAERYLYKGAIVPSGVHADEIKRLVKIGLIERVTIEAAPKAEDTADETAGGDQSKAPAGGTKK